MANEKRLIDANAIEMAMNERYMELVGEYGHYDHYTEGYGDGLYAVENAPTVDAVEVVRCGKCLYYSETTGKDSGKPCGYGVCTKPFHITNIVTNEDFCSFGQRGAYAKMGGDGNG